MSLIGLFLISFNLYSQDTKLSKDEQKEAKISNIGIYDVSMTINSDRIARATISGLSRGKLIYDGRILPKYDSSVYKGRNSI